MRILLILEAVAALALILLFPPDADTLRHAVSHGFKGAVFLLPALALAWRLGGKEERWNALFTLRSWGRLALTVAAVLLTRAALTGVGVHASPGLVALPADPLPGMPWSAALGILSEGVTEFVHGVSAIFGWLSAGLLLVLWAREPEAGFLETLALLGGVCLSIAGLGLFAAVAPPYQSDPGFAAALQILDLPAGQAMAAIPGRLPASAAYPLWSFPAWQIPVALLLAWRLGNLGGGAWRLAGWAGAFYAVLLALSGRLLGWYTLLDALFGVALLLAWGAAFRLVRPRLRPHAAPSQTPAPL